MDSIEQAIIYSLLNDPAYFQKAFPFIKDEYFRDVEKKEVFKLLQKYVDKHDEVPSRVELRTMLNAVDIEGDDDGSMKESAINVINYTAGDDEINTDWIMAESEEYCRTRATYLAILESLDIIEGNKKKLKVSVVPEILERAINLKFDNDIGIDFWNEIDRKLNKYDEEVVKIPARLGMINKITNGGWERKTVNGVAAPTGFGKSIWLGDEAVFQSQQGYNVAYITFEMSDERIEGRLEANALDETLNVVKTTPLDELKKKFEGLRGTKHGHLFLKEYGPGEITAQNLSNYLKEVKMRTGESIDILCVDYMNLMSSLRYPASAGTYLMLKGICEELVSLAKKHNIVILTATQFNRGGQNNSSPQIKDISESQAIANTLDFLLAMYDNEELQKMDKAVMKQLKNRYGDKNYFKSFIVGINRAKMKFYDVSEQESRDLADNVETPAVVDVDNGPVFDKSKSSDKFASFKNFSFD
jgi:replicative DNA helicase